MQTNPTETAGTPAANADAVADPSGVVAGQPTGTGAGAEGQPVVATEGEPASDPVADPNATPEEGKPADGKPAEGEPEGAPEAYQDFVLPENFELIPEARTGLEEFGRKHNLSQSAAQEALDLAVAHTGRVQEAYATAWRDKVAQWGEQVKSDPVVGGRQYAENAQIAQAAIAKYGDAELTAMFDEYGLGNHPALVRAFYRIGKAGGESGFVAGQGNEAPVFTGSREEQLAQRMAAEQARGKK